MCSGRIEACFEGWHRAHNTPTNLLTLLEYWRVTLSTFFFYDSDLIVPHLYSSLNFTASEAILNTQHSPKGPNPTPIQINSLQWSLFVASQQDWILLPSGPRSVCHSSSQILLQQEQASVLLSTCTADNSNLSFIFLKCLVRFKTPAARRIESIKNTNRKRSKRIFNSYKKVKEKQKYDKIISYYRINYHLRHP